MNLPENKAAEVNAKLAALRNAPHNGKMYQPDDVDYLLALAETMGRGLGAINPKWFRDQAKLVKGTLEKLDELESELAIWKPLTPEEAEKAISEAEAVPISREQIERIMAKVRDPASRPPESEAVTMAAKIKQQSAELEQLKRLLAERDAEIERLRKILAHVPGKVAIKAKEDAGYGDEIHAKDEWPTEADCYRVVQETCAKAIAELAAEREANERMRDALQRIASVCLKEPGISSHRRDLWDAAELARATLSSVERLVKCGMNYESRAGDCGD